MPAFLWFAGLALGVFFSSLCSIALFSVIRFVPSGVQTYFSLIASQMLPLLLTLIFGYALRSAVLLVVVFLKGFFFSFISFALLSAFGASSWLVLSLVMFSDLLLMPVLWWLWLDIFSDKIRSETRGIVFSVAVVLAVCSLDCAVVAPFLASLI